MNVGDLTVTISGEVQPLLDALKSAEGALTRFNGLASRLTSLSDLALAGDTSVASLQALELAAAGTGKSLADLGKMAADFAGKLEHSNKDAAEGFKMLSLEAEKFNDIGFDERLLLIAKRFQETGKTVEEQAEILDKFGLKSKEVFELIRDGGEKIETARNTLKQYGMALSDIDAHTAAMAHKQLDEVMAQLKTTGQGLWDQFALVAAPVVDLLARSLLGLGGSATLTEGMVVSAFKGMLGAMDDFFDSAVKKSVTIFGGDGWFAQKLREFAFSAAKTFGFITDETQEEFDKIFKLMGKTMGEFEGRVVPGPNMKEWFQTQQDALKASAQKYAEWKAKIDALFRGKDDDDKSGNTKALEARFDAIKQASDFEFSARKDAFERRSKQLDDEKFLEIKTAEEIAAVKTQLQAKFEIERQKMLFDSVQSYYATEAEQAAAQAAKKLLLLEDALKAEVITEAQYADMRVKINQKAAENIMLANAKAYTALANIVDTSMGQISALVDKEGKKQFTIFKAISVATALVKGYEAVVSAFAAGNKVGGPPVGFAFAAIAAAGVAAQIAKLVSTDVGSGAGTVTAPAAGDTGAAAATLPNAGSTLTVQGVNPSDIFSGEQIRNLSEKLIAFQRDGGTVVFK